MATAAGAAVGKLLANLALAVTIEGFKEALVLGESQGLSEEQVVDMLGSTGLEFIVNMKAPFLLGERDTAPGAPDEFVEGEGELIEYDGRADKVRIVKFRRRKHHRKQMGHRQHYTEIEITGIAG